MGKTEHSSCSNRSCTTRFSSISEPSKSTQNSARYRAIRRYRHSPETPNGAPVTGNFAHLGACLRLHNPYLHFARDVEVPSFSRGAGTLELCSRRKTRFPVKQGKYREKLHFG